MFCGLDLGTTNINALLVDAQGSVVARSSSPVSRAKSPMPGNG